LQNGVPDVIPMLSYEDGVRALDWLGRAFGFVETARVLGHDGKLAHGAMRAGSGLIMLATPTADYQGPKHHRENCEAAWRWSTVPWVIDGVLVYVPDLDAHCERARAAGAVILTPIEDGPPGRRWFFFEKET